MSILLQKKNVGDYSYMSSPNIYYRAQIVNAFVLPYSNGFTEGCNNNIKVLKRISYGLRHFDRFRVRILLLSKKNSASYLDS